MKSTWKRKNEKGKKRDWTKGVGGGRKLDKSGGMRERENRHRRRDERKGD